jgi:hypothetical protein
VPIFDTDDSQTALGFMSDYLFSALATRENKLFIVEKFLNLLTFFHEESVVELPELRQTKLLCKESKGQYVMCYKIEINLLDRPFGTCIVISFVPKLLEYLKDAIPKDLEASRNSDSINFTLLEKHV